MYNFKNINFIIVLYFKKYSSLHFTIKINDFNKHGFSCKLVCVIVNLMEKYEYFQNFMENSCKTYITKIIQWKWLETKLY